MFKPVSEMTRLCSGDREHSRLPLTSCLSTHNSQQLTTCWPWSVGSRKGTLPPEWRAWAHTSTLMVTSSLQKANKRNHKASSNHTRSVINRAATLLCSGACSSCDRNTENVLELGHNEEHKLRWKPSARLREEAGAMECVQERQNYQSQGDRLKQSPHLFLMVSFSKNTLTVSISHMRPMETKVAQCGQRQPASMWERQSIWRSYWCTLPVQLCPSFLGAECLNTHQQVLFLLSCLLPRAVSIPLLTTVLRKPTHSMKAWEDRGRLHSLDPRAAHYEWPFCQVCLSV